ncbi:MAG: hypothetical protein WAY02_13770 [Burkholderiaceae bacterium]
MISLRHPPPSQLAGKFRTWQIEYKRNSTNVMVWHSAPGAEFITGLLFNKLLLMFPKMMTNHSAFIFGLVGTGAGQPLR